MLVQEDSSETCKITSFVIFNKNIWYSKQLCQFKCKYVKDGRNNWRTCNIPGRGGEFWGITRFFRGAHGFSGDHTVFQGITRFFRGSHSFVGVKEKTFFEDFQSKVDGNFDSFRQYFIFFTLILNKKLQSPQIKIKYWSPKNILQIIFREDRNTSGARLKFSNSR